MICLLYIKITYWYLEHAGWTKQQQQHFYLTSTSVPYDSNKRKIWNWKQKKEFCKLIKIIYIYISVSFSRSLNLWVIYFYFCNSSDFTVSWGGAAKRHLMFISGHIFQHMVIAIIRVGTSVHWLGLVKVTDTVGQHYFTPQRP